MKEFGQIGVQDFLECKQAFLLCHILQVLALGWQANGFLDSVSSPAPPSFIVPMTQNFPYKFEELYSLSFY